MQLDLRTVVLIFKDFAAEYFFPGFPYCLFFWFQLNIHLYFFANETTQQNSKIQQKKATQQITTQHALYLTCHRIYSTVSFALTQ